MAIQHCMHLCLESEKWVYDVCWYLCVCVRLFVRVQWEYKRVRYRCVRMHIGLSAWCCVFVTYRHVFPRKLLFHVYWHALKTYHICLRLKVLILGSDLIYTIDGIRWKKLPIVKIMQSILPITQQHLIEISSLEACLVRSLLLLLLRSSFLPLLLSNYVTLILLYR